jgi:prevent-host-death family protein
MEKAISAADANRKFSQVLREVREGRSYVVTSHGRPVARIAPVQTAAKRAAAASARNSLLARLRSQTVVNIGSWKRDELYE